MDVRKYKFGEYIHVKGETPDGLHLIVKGQATVVYDTLGFRNKLPAKSKRKDAQSLLAEANEMSPTKNQVERILPLTKAPEHLQTVLNVKSS